MELVRVRNLCGTFCFSMQFVVFMDLLGTATLPVAIALTYSLVVSMILSPPNDFEKAIPLILLLAVIGLPAVLILITTRKVVYVFWMLIYLVALPVWNFLLPIYSFWHFDDFSWGETRKVEGELKGAGHDDGKATLGRSTLPMRRWEDWERSRLRKLKRDEKRRRDMEKAFPQGFTTVNGDLAAPRNFDTYSHADTSDTISVTSSEEDMWGAQIGGYNEHSASYPPPPVGLTYLDNSFLASSTTLGNSDMEAILESGFDDPSPSGSLRSSSRSYQQFRPAPLPNTSRYELSEPPSGRNFDAYSSSGQSHGNMPQPPREHVISPISPFIPANGSSSAVQWQGHAKKRSIGKSSGGSGGAYGPLGPLDPQER